MKKLFIKFLCLGCSVIILLTACQTTSKKDKNDFDIKNEEILISFNMIGGYAGDCYTFALTPDNRLLAEYRTGNETQQVQIQLSEEQISSMGECLEETLSLTEEDISFFVGISDYWYCTIRYDNVVAKFDYGASKSTTVNILLEQIIGCVDSEKALKTKENLKPKPSLFREVM